MGKIKICISSLLVLAMMLSFSGPSFSEETVTDPISFKDLKAAFPQSDQFSYKKEISKAAPHVYYAYSIDPDTGKDILLGYVLETYDWASEIVGFRGLIKMLVGIDLRGRIVGLTIVEHKEDPPSLQQIENGWFIRQFIGKTASDSLEVGKDIEAVSQATVTSQAIARALKGTLKRFSGLEKITAEGTTALEPVAAQKLRNEELVKKERELDRMLKEKKLSLTPARYYKVMEE